MSYPQIIDLKNEARQVPVVTDKGIARHNPFPEGGDVSVRLLKFIPGATTHRHNHTEVEFWTVLSGGVRIYLDERDFLLFAGESLRVDPLHRHRIEALDSGAVMQTMWWHSRKAFEEATKSKEADRKLRPLLLAPAMLTPNGHMHVGHAAGPFVYADVLQRIAKMMGRDSFVLQGTHGHLEHIGIAADAAGIDYYELAERNTASFKQSLQLLDAVPDIFIGTKPNNRDAEIVLEVFERLFSKGLVVEREHLVPYDARSGRFIVDAFVHGKCPHCEGYSSGTECEDCGALVLDAELKDPVDLDGHALERRPLKRLFLNLASMYEDLEAFSARQLLPLHAKLYIEAWLARGIPEICISNPNREGIQIPLKGYNKQRFNVVMEYVPRHLIALEKIKENCGQQFFWYQIPRDEIPELDILFGVDNSFGRLLVIPGILFALDLKELVPNRVFPNHMLTLEGKKFSTSRRHAIWINDIIDEDGADPLRFYLCHLRPEGAVTDFSVRSYEIWKGQFWKGRLPNAIARASAVVQRVSSDDVPGPGQWSATDVAFLGSCRRFNADVKARFDTEYPEICQLTYAIEAFVSEIERYASSALQVPLPAKVNEALARTAARLLTLALVSLSVAASPIAPRFSRSIADRLGLGVPEIGWLERDWMTELVRLSASFFDGKELNAAASCSDGKF